jgi:hypothetical protein
MSHFYRSVFWFVGTLSAVVRVPTNDSLGSMTFNRSVFWFVGTRTKAEVMKSIVFIYQ